MARLIVKAPYYKPKHKTAQGQSRGGYLEYVATREGVGAPRSGMVGYVGERRGSHGLFSDEGVKINLSTVRREIDEHPGNVWGIIISLKREDAERLGYNTAEEWMNLLRSHRNDIAKEMNIAPSNLRWVAAYHNKEKNPHVHMMVWSTRPQEPHLSRMGIHNIKQTLAGYIFRQELISIYKKQTTARDVIKDRYRERIKELASEIENGNHTFSPELMLKLQFLSEKLQKHKGKKVYGYLDKNTKELVNEIVKMLGIDEKIAEIYNSWYGYKCETVRTYTDEMPEKIPIENNEEFKSIRNSVVKIASELHLPTAQPDREIDYDYKELADKANDFEYLYKRATLGNPYAMYRLGRYYLERTDDMENAEYWLQQSADEGVSLASYLIYKGYRDGKFEETPSNKMKYLHKAVDAGFGYAEYEYAKYLKDKSPETAKEYLMRAASHGSFQAEYMLGKMLYEEGKREEAKKWLERSAQNDEWTKTRVGLLLYYGYEDYEKGTELLRQASESGYVPAEEALKAIKSNLNAQLVTGVCNLFYYASRIIDNETENMYNKEHQVNYHGIDRKERRAIRAKKQGLGLKGI